MSAGRVDVDPARGTLTLEERVRLGFGRFRIEAEQLVITQRPDGLAIEGQAHLAACPCPGPPLTLGVSGARLDQDGDAFLWFPRLELYRVPFFALPALWLRAPDKPGLLPPILELRGDDGLLLGGGARMPFREANGAAGAVELTAAGYVKGGAEVGARLTSTLTTTRIRWDEIDGRRATIATRGATGAGGLAFAWNADALRGDRAIEKTVDLFDATRPFDTAAAEVSFHRSASPANPLVDGGVSARAARAGAPVVAGPYADAALGGALGRAGAWDAAFGATVLGRSTASGAVPIAEGSLGSELDARPGPFLLRLGTRGRARAADDTASGASREAVAAASASAGVPLVRRFEGAPGTPGLVHTIDPTLELRGSLGARRGSFFLPVFGEVPSSAWLATAGAATAFGNYTGRAVRLDARAGLASAEGATPSPGALGRLTFEAPVAAGTIEGAGVGPAFGATAPGPSAALVGKVRIGPRGGLHLSLNLASQEGAFAHLARALAEDALAALPEPFFAASGFSGGAEVAIPWTREIQSRVRADADLGVPELLDMVSSLAYRSRCGCLAVELTVGHRLGRAGASAQLLVDLAPARAN